jgi:hypothetical protein
MSMPQRLRIRFLVCLTGLGIVAFTGSHAQGRETEAQLLQHIQSEQNPVRKSKYELKLADLKLEQAQDAYGQNNPEQGAKLLGAFVDSMRASWKALQESGRKPVKQPQGFKELDISLREHARTLEDLARRVAYFDRGPVEKAAQEMERIRGEVLQALFPAKGSSNSNPPAPKLFSSPARPG